MYDDEINLPTYLPTYLPTFSAKRDYECQIYCEYHLLSDNSSLPYVTSKLYFKVIWLMYMHVILCMWKPFSLITVCAICQALYRFEKIARQLLFSYFFLKSPVLRWYWLKCQIFMNFSSHLHFLKNSRGKSWLLVKDLGVWVTLSYHIFIMSSRSIHVKKAQIVLAPVKEVPRTSLIINTVCNF